MDNDQDTDDETISRKKYVREIPSLMKLAAEKVKRTNPNLFFQFHDRPLQPQIQAEYVIPMVNRLIEQRKNSYSEKVEARRQKVESLVESFTDENSSYWKWVCFLGFIAGGGLYLGVGCSILSAINASVEVWATFYATTPAGAVAGACSTIGFFLPGARTMAECVTPTIPAEVIDFDVEAQKPKGGQF